MKINELPYVMGNVGDLLKHGLLAEYTDYYFSTMTDTVTNDFVFWDVFGGRAYLDNPPETIVNRLKMLNSCALLKAQEEFNHRYFGSSFIVKNLAQSHGVPIKVFVSDREQQALNSLLSHDFYKLDVEGFNEAESFTVLDAEVSSGCASLLLLDPYSDFVSDYSESVIPKLSTFVDSRQIPVILFVLLDGNEVSRSDHQNYQAIKDKYLTRRIRQVTIRCSALPASKISGECKFDVEVVLMLPNCSKMNIQAFNQRLRDYFNQLEKILEVPISVCIQA